MKDRWRQVAFGELVDQKLLEIGDGYRAKISELGGDGPIFLRAGHVADTHIDFEGADRFHVNRKSNLASKMGRAGDVVITTKGNSTGRVAFINGSMPHFVYSPHLSYWRSLDTQKIVPSFLRYWSKGPEFHAQLKGLAASTDMAPYLSLSDQRRLKISLPPCAEQQSIGETLSALDDKIELNRRMNETLEAMARGIFKSWFIDFDPVRAKSEGRQPFGMTAETAALFPNEFQDSRNGKTPKGWKIEPLSEVMEINPRRFLDKTQLTAHVDMQNLPTNGHRVSGWSKRAFISGSKFTNGDTLLARITPCLENGKTAFVDFLQDGEAAWGSTEFVVLRPKGTLPPEFAYCLAREESFRTYAIRNMTGSSGRQRVASIPLAQFSLSVPPLPVADIFGGTIRPFFAKIKANSEESTTIEAIRDALLPRLVSGQIQVKEAHNIVGKHA